MDGLLAGLLPLEAIENTENVIGSDFEDSLTGNEVDNLIDGHSGADTISGGAGHDLLRGSGGNDVIYGDAGNDKLNGGTGADDMFGGIGNDVYQIDSTGDSVAENANEGSDLVRSQITYALGANVEDLTLLGSADLDGTGNNLANRIQGNDGANTLTGLDGADALLGYHGDDTILGGGGNDFIVGGARYDTLQGGAGDDGLRGGLGLDTLFGGAGADYLIGGEGKDSLTGGNGGDIFQFLDGDTSVQWGSADVIHDFDQAASNEKIHLKKIDADVTQAGDQQFSWISSKAFSGAAGELHFVQTAGGNTFVEGDIDGDGIADFAIRLDGLVDLTGGDFVL